MRSVGVAAAPRVKISQLSKVTNPSSIHGIYPYRGKISARDAELTIGQFEPGKTLLDPFCGSGTITYEGHRAGLTSIGFDTNPLAVWLARGKLSMAHISLETALQEAGHLIAQAAKHPAQPMPPDAGRHFHDTTAAEIMALVPALDQMSEYVKACFFGTIALAARGCNDYQWTSSTVGKDIIPKRYIDFNQKFLHKVKKTLLPTLKPAGFSHPPDRF